jgi:hypothetical protein
VTEGLLNSPFHDKSNGDRRRDLDEFRSQLADAVFVDVGNVGGKALQAANLPLFKRSAQGLEQVVRLRLVGTAAQGPRDAAPAEALSVSFEGAPGGGGPVRFERQGLAQVLVPEVRSPQQCGFTVRADNGEVVCRGELTLRPQRKWSVSLVHHTHLDVGYTDRQEVVTANHLQYLDSVLELVERTSGWDDDARFRWNVEVNWPLERWFASRGTRDRRRMIDAVNAGHVGISAMSLNMHTEACAIEELYEMVRYAVELRAEHGLAVTTAMQTDVPGGVSGLVEVLADMGVKFLSVAHNYAGRSVPYLIGGEKLGRPFYWKAPSGKRLLVWHTDTLHGNAYMEGNILGLAESFAVAQDSLPCYLAALAERSYPFDSGTWLPEAEKVVRDPYPHDILHLRVQGKYGDNAPPNLAVSEIARDWDAAWAYPRLRVDRNEEFYGRALERLGGSIPEWQGDWADWWADGLGSGARMIGWARQAQGSVRVGRALNAVADLISGKPPAPVAGTSQAYEEIGLFDEHTWGARHPWKDDEEGWGSGDLQWQRKASFARNAREAAASLVELGARRAAELVGGHRGLAHVVVFNAGGRARTDVVKVFLPFSTVPGDVEVGVQDDRDGAKIATLALPQEHVAHRPAGRFLQFLARDVPSLGYARFNVVEGAPAPVEVSRPGDAVVENEFYRVTYAAMDASIASLLELATGRDLVNTRARLGFNAYVFDRYGTAPKVDHLSGRVFSRALDLIADRVTGEAAVIVRHEVSDLGQSMTLDVRAPGCSRLLTTITAWRGVPRVEIHNRMWKDRTVDKQSVFFSFPFAASAPDLVYELPGLGTSASSPTVPGCPQHMRAVRHWVALAEETGTTAWATVDAPLVQFGDIHSPYSPFPGTLSLDEPEPGTIYSWALNNIWDTNFPTEQGGEMSFRYAVTSSGTSSGTSSATSSGTSSGNGNAVSLGTQLGDSVSTPLVATIVPSTTGGGLAASGSLCLIERGEVRLVQATPSRDGRELLLWLNNMAEEEVATTVRFPDLVVTTASSTTVFEDGRTDLVVQDNSTVVRLKAGETRALAVGGDLSFAPTLQT